MPTFSEKQPGRTTTALCIFNSAATERSRMDGKHDKYHGRPTSTYFWFRQALNSLGKPAQSAYR